MKGIQFRDTELCTPCIHRRLDAINLVSNNRGRREIEETSQVHKTQ